MNFSSRSRLIGTSSQPLQIEDTGLYTVVNLDSSRLKKVSRGFIQTPTENTQYKIYLCLENVKGNMDNNMLKVSVNQQSVGSAALFGLSYASIPASHHSGEGLKFAFDVTEIVNQLYSDNEYDLNSLDIHISTLRKVSDEHEITIGQISLYQE